MGEHIELLTRYIYTFNVRNVKSVIAKCQFSVPLSIRPFFCPSVAPASFCNGHICRVGIYKRIILRKKVGKHEEIRAMELLFGPKLLLIINQFKLVKSCLLPKITF